MSTVPVPERIATELVSRLQQITVGNGYAITVVNVARVNRDASGWTPRHLGIVLVQGTETRNEEHDCPGNPPAMAYELEFGIHGFVRQPDRTTAPDATTMNKMAAAIRKAIAGTATWYQIDNACYDADWSETDDVVSPDHAICSMGIVARYRVSELDPLEVRA